MIFQDPMTSLNPTMPIGEQIAETVRVHQHTARAAAVDRAVEVLDLVGMPRPRERLGALPAPAVRRPAPAGHDRDGAGLRAVDPDRRRADHRAWTSTIQAQILGLLDRLKAELGTAMLLISHDMGVIAGARRPGAVMYAGRIVEQAETVEFFDHIRHPYAEALLRFDPAAGPGHRPRQLYSIPGSPPDLSEPAAGMPVRAALPVRAPSRCRAEDPKLGGRGRRARNTPASTRCRPTPPRRRPPGCGWRGTCGRGRRGTGTADEGDVILRAREAWSRITRSPGESCSARCGSVQGGVRRVASRSGAARRSAWSASPAAARPRSGRLHRRAGAADLGKHRRSADGGHRRADRAAAAGPAGGGFRPAP